MLTWESIKPQRRYSCQWSVKDDIVPGVERFYQGVEFRRTGRESAQAYLLFVRLLTVYYTDEGRIRQKRPGEKPGLVSAVKPFVAANVQA